MKKNIKKVSVAKVALIGAGLSAIGAGGYYLFGPKGKDHQDRIKFWMAGMEEAISNELQKVKDISKPIYHNVVDLMAKTYSKNYKDNSKEINLFARKLKGEWKNIKNVVNQTTKADK